MSGETLRAILSKGERARNFPSCPEVADLCAVDAGTGKRWEHLSAFL
jgi:hypothetical protein